MQKRIPVVTYILIGINAVVFFLETLMGGSENLQVALSFGALYTPLVTEYGQWWRLFTAMFLHFGIQHLGSNMISLWAIGPYAETFFGKARYLLLYLVSGICGNLLTVAVELHTGSYALSAGASGAICGLLSVFLIFALMPQTRRAFPLPRVLAAIALVLLPGLTDQSISMTAHLGGLIGGFLLSAVMTLLMRHKIRKQRGY
ncbi:MAG: rhomboid family intramembrane serine protease [Lachnospiraceae bacterium]